MQVTSPRASRRRALVAVATVGVIVVAGCANKKDEAVPTTQPREMEAQAEAAPTTQPGDGVPDAGGRLVVSGEAIVSSPWLPSTMRCDSYCQTRARTFFEPIAAIAEDGSTQPFLAESITPNDDFSEWTIVVRPGITFTDGTPLDAAAMIQNLNATGGGFLAAGQLADLARNDDGTLAIEQADEMTFTIPTGEGGDPARPISWPDFPYLLTNQLGFVASPTWLDAVADGTASATEPVGTGPFVVESYTDDLLVVTRNDEYWQRDDDGVQLPYLDEIEFRVIADAETAADALRNGDIDIFSTPNTQVVSDLEADPDDFGVIEQRRDGDTNFLLYHLNQEGTELTDRRVRCALSMAIDRQEIIDATAAGLPLPANGPFSPGQQGHLDDNGFDPAPRPDEARDLIEDYEDETGRQVEITFGKLTSAINDQQAELISGYWRDIGVDVEVVSIEQSKLITNALFGVEDFEVYSFRLYGGHSIDEQYALWHSSTALPNGELTLNFGRVADPVIDENLRRARTSIDPDERQAAAEAVNRQFADECWIAPTLWTVWGVNHDLDIGGLGTMRSPDGSTLPDGAGFAGSVWLHRVWLETAP